VLGATKRFAADDALVWFEAGVDDAVSLEVRQTSEPFVADTACNLWLVSGMTPHMHLQCTAALVAPPTFHTFQLCLHNLRVFRHPLPGCKSVLVNGR